MNRTSRGKRNGSKSIVIWETRHKLSGHYSGRGMSLVPDNIEAIRADPAGEEGKGRHKRKPNYKPDALELQKDQHGEKGVEKEKKTSISK